MPDGMYPATGPDSIHFDYRILALLLTFASSADLLDSYRDPNEQSKPDTDSTKWQALQDLGFPLEMLKENLYLFMDHNGDKETYKAFQRIQTVWQTMVNLNIYCKIGCPSQPILQQITNYTTGLQQPLLVP